MASGGWSIQEVTSFYGSYAKEYDEDIKLETYPAPFAIGSWVLDFLLRVRPAQSGKAPQEDTRFKLLDLGCGTGQSSKMFFSHPSAKFDVYGVDATPQMLEKAKLLPFKELICQDVERPLPFNRTTFDAIVCVGVMDFIRNPTVVLNDVSLILKESGEGCFGVTFPDPQFSRSEVEALFRQTGFLIERHERFFGYKDSQSGESVYYHGYLLTQSDGPSLH
ncbi:hypothetical protein HK104_008796 [Borealophlyctis nickersoniae]|nr:hypothetical protein HK104_008796 [Borealophlyctis nickersoniae]